MPTPDRREWLTPREIIRTQLETVKAQHPNISRTQLESLKDSLIDGFRQTGYQQELKIARLVEKIKEAAVNGLFGPLWIPNSVDQNGQKIPTPVGVMTSLLIDIYTDGFLDMHDEDGNPIEAP